MAEHKIDDLKSSQNSYVFGTKLASVQDFRMDRRRKFELGELIQVAVCAVLSGADNWNEIESFARAKEAWLKRFFRLESGLPSHDTFRRVFSLLKPEALDRIFETWVLERVDLTSRQQIAIDGKSLRGSRDHKTDPVHIVSAFLPGASLVLGQERVPKKQNELEAIYRLLNRLPVSGHTITIDALGCQMSVVAGILAHKADYLLALKRNQPATYDEVFQAFLKLMPTPKKACDFDDRFDESHGRVVRRTTRVLRNLRWIKTKDRWQDLKSLIEVESVRRIKSTGEVGREKRYFISSLQVTAKEFQEMIRGHWGIENRLHWVLDVSFKEDQSRIRFKNAAENFSLLRRLSLNLIRSQSAPSAGVLSNRRRAGWDENFLESLLLPKPVVIAPPPETRKPFDVSELFLSPASYRAWSESIR